MRFLNRSLLCFLLALTLSQTCLATFSSDEHTAKIVKRAALEQEARMLERQGLYDESFKKYKEAIDPSLLNYDYDAGVAHGGIRRIYLKRREYQLALQELQWHLQRNPEKYQDDKLELEALIRSQETHSSQPILDYIKFLKNKYKKQTFPFNYNPYFEEINKTIIRLYDHMGDMDGGIDFCDEILRYWEKKSGQDLHRLGNKNPYFLIRQAFEQDKKEGFKGCLDAKPGEVCMGRATKALIQSDYFPW
jgi:tetratricopeptide (TPR) repeat protein